MPDNWLTGWISFILSHFLAFEFGPSPCEFAVEDLQGLPKNCRADNFMVSHLKVSSSSLHMPKVEWSCRKRSSRQKGDRLPTKVPTLYMSMLPDPFYETFHSPALAKRSENGVAILLIRCLHLPGPIEWLKVILSQDNHMSFLLFFLKIYNL